MTDQFNFKTEWEKTKKQFTELSHQVAVVLEKGEKEAVKLSQKGKLHIDSAAASLKVEKLCYMIGKEYLKLKDPSKPTQKVISMAEEAKAIIKDQKAIQKKIEKV